MPRIDTCKGCGVLFKTPHLSRIPEFCSLLCRKDYFKNQRQTICEFCGKTFERWQAATEQQFCSHLCYGRSRIKNNGTHFCQFCGITFFDQKHPNRKYCSEKCFRAANKSDNPRVHSNKPKPQKITKQCLYCSKEFIVSESKAQRQFCSRSCSNSRKDPSKKIARVCQVCNKEFEGWTYRNSVACSRACASKMSIGHPKPTKQRPEIHIIKNCLWCDREYKTTTHQERLRGSNFCSRDCQAEYSSVTKRGDGNPNWTGGHTGDYGPNWERQKRKAKKRDGYTCQVCGYKRGGGRYLDVHHIRPYKHFNGDWESANQLDNLITLCRTCHPKVEKGKILLRADSEICPA